MKHSNYRFLVVPVFLACAITLNAAQLPYFTNLSAALDFARKDSRRVILYTGNAEKCAGKSPRSYFDDIILKKYPRLGEVTNLYAVCERFIYVPSRKKSGEFDPVWLQESSRFNSLYSKYYIPTFFPTLTFISPEGRLLNGPFWELGYGDEYSGNIDSYYETLREYLAVERPLNIDIARTNLHNAVLSVTAAAETVFGLFRCLQLTNGGKQELLQGNGATSRKYEVGEPFKFAIREIRREVRNSYPWGEHQYGVTIVASGQFKDSESFTGLFLVRLNGAWFTGNMLDSTKTLPNKSEPGPYGMTLMRGEHHFFLDLMDESVGVALVKQLEHLRPTNEPQQPK